MAGWIGAVISARNTRLKSQKGKILEIKGQINELKLAQERRKNFTLINKIDRKIFGYYPYEDLKNPMAYEKKLNRLLKKLERGKKPSSKEKYEFF